MKDNIGSVIQKICKIFKAYIAVTKPRLVILLFFTGFVSITVASSIYGFNWKNIGIVSAAILLSVMGSNACTAYIDRNMDLVMSRTQTRPVPSGIIYPARNALFYGLVLFATGIVLGAVINYMTALFIFLGFFDSVIVYNLISKKRSPLNILLGAPAGGMPVFVGWASVAQGRIDPIAIFMFLLVMAWTPAHIWSLAYFYNNDYKKANVPMLPAIWSSKKVFALLSILNVILVFFSLFTGFYLGLSLIYIVSASLLGTLIIIFSIILLIKNSKKTVWLLFKFSSPYLTVIFILLLLEYIWL